MTQHNYHRVLHRLPPALYSWHDILTRNMTTGTDHAFTIIIAGIQMVSCSTADQS